MQSIINNTSATGVLRYLAGIALVAATAVCLSTPATARADDDKFYSGSHCQANNDSRTTILARNSNGIRNLSYTSSAWVTCPVIRDNTVNTSGNDKAYVYTYQDSSTITRFFCRLQSSSTFGSVSDNATASLLLSQTGNRYLYLDLDSSYRWGPYTLTCLIPPRSRIHSIFFGEH